MTRTTITNDAPKLPTSEVLNAASLKVAFELGRQLGRSEGSGRTAPPADPLANQQDRPNEFADVDLNALMDQPNG